MATADSRTTRPNESSYALCRKHFDSPHAAAKYPARYGRSFRDRREQRCLLKAVSHFAPGSEILDCPCGTGRLLPLLVARGFHVTAADSSPHMVARAEALWRNPVGQAALLAPGTVPQLYEWAAGYEHDPATSPHEPGARAPQTATQPALLPRTIEAPFATVRFEVRDVMNTGYQDGRFDGVVCNRLFHHFTEPDTRVAALWELRRISTGPLVVSFFNSFALDALRSRLKHALRGTEPYCRSYVSLRQFTAEMACAGLSVVETIPLLRGFSPMWYVVARPSDD